MRVYFLSEKSGVLFLNGIALGRVDLFERVCEIDPKDGIFCEVKVAGYTAVSFVFSEEFLLDPPPQIKLYYTEGAVAVYACDFLRADPSMKLLAQERFSDCRLTLFFQGKLQLEYSRGANFTLVPLPDYLENGTICRIGQEFLIESEEGFALLSGEGKLITAARGRVTEKEYALAAEIPFGDSTGHIARCRWENGAMTSCAIVTQRDPNEATFALALFESALIGADFTPYLCDALQEKAGALKEFLGNYTSVVLSDVPSRVGLVYPRKERIFDIRYFNVTVADGKVTNISEE